MRRAILIFIVAILLSFTADSISNADNAIAGKDAKTRIETFLTQKGRLLVKEVYMLGRITGFNSSSCVINGIMT